MNKKKLILSYLYIFFTVIIIGLLLSNSINGESLKSLFKDMNYNWFIMSFVCIFMHWLMDSIIVYQIAPFITNEKIKLVNCIRYGVVGLYYAALTPFSSGGQPFQVVYMKRDGIPVGKATAIVSVKHFVYLSAMCFSFIMCMILRGSAFFRNYHAVFWIAVLGFLVNLTGVILIFITMTNEARAIKICKGVIMVLHRIRIVRDHERAFLKIENVILDFSQAAGFVFTNKFKVFITFILSFIKLSFLFAVPFTIFKAFNLTGYDLIDLSSLNTFMFLTVSFMPTPGTSFAAEGGFNLIYLPIFGSLTAMAIAIWRVITYYLILIAGGLTVVFDQLIHIRKSPRN